MRQGICTVGSVRAIGRSIEIGGGW